VDSTAPDGLDDGLGMIVRYHMRRRVLLKGSASYVFCGHCGRYIVSEAPIDPSGLCSESESPFVPANTLPLGAQFVDPKRRKSDPWNPNLARQSNHESNLELSFL
jgi:hypothetical protein